MQVGEVLDLRHRQQAGQPRAEREAEDGLLVEQRVEHPARRRTRPSRPRVTPYTPPLRATSSPKTSMPGRAARASVERRVDRLGQGQRPGRPRAAGRRTRGRRGRRLARPQAAPAATCVRAARRERRHHLRGAWPAGARRRPRAATRRAPGPATASYRASTSSGGEQRRPLTSSRAVPSSGSAARSAAISAGRRYPVSTSEPACPPKPHHAQVQERGRAPVAGPRPPRPARCRRRRPGRRRRRGSSRCPARPGRRRPTQPGGVRTLMPSPLSSHTISSGSGRCW